MTGKRSTGKRGKCPYCARTYSVNTDGKLRKHSRAGKRGAFCGGSGQRPT